MEALVDRLEQAVNRLEVVSDKLQGCSGSLSNGEMNGYHGESQCMDAFDNLLRGPLSEYLKNSRTIGGDVAKHAEMVHSALLAQKTFLKLVTTHQEPSQISSSSSPYGLELMRSSMRHWSLCAHRDYFFCLKERQCITFPMLQTADSRGSLVASLMSFYRTLVCVVRGPNRK
ncbi:adenylyl cyclase-associated protein 2 isoform X1 [Tachysurus ichikawai]